MEKACIYLNFKKHSGTSIGSGHRSSNGWVTSWTDYVKYKLTINNINLRLPLTLCKTIQDFLLSYQDYENSNQDWGVSVSEYNIEENINIVELIHKLNSSQNIIEFQESQISQPYDISTLLSDSLNEHNASLKIIDNTRFELNKKIYKLKADYKKLTVERLYPHFKTLLEHNQVDFFITYADLEYYPLDIIAINNDYDLLVSSIIKFNPPFNSPNEIYIALSTGQYSYFEIKSGTIKCLSTIENKKLSTFINSLEREHGYSKYSNDGYSSPALYKGMATLVRYFLLNKEYDNYDKLMENYIYSSRKTGFYGFDKILKFAYISDSRWDKISLIRYCHDWDSDSRFISDTLFGAGVVYDSNWMPFLKRILDNEDAIEKLSLFYNNTTSVKDYIRGRIKNIISELERE